MDLKLKDKVVVVTGASGGIGSEIVRQLKSCEAKIAIHFHKNRASADRLASEVPRSIVVQADLTNEVDVSRMWNDVEATLGPVDVLIANAGICIGYGKPFHEISLEQWNETIAGNLTSVFLSAREFFRSIHRHKTEAPSIVIIGSTAGQFGEAQNTDYAASKSPLSSGFLLSLKNEIVRISPRGRVNTICPSWTLTDMVESLVAKPEHTSKVLQTVALRKIARPVDVANTALFLSSPALSGHITGQVITLAGGMEGRVLFDKNEIDLSCV